MDLSTSSDGNNISVSVLDGKNHVAGLILARGGSKGIPRKNIQIVAGKPLLSWVIEPMKKSQNISSIWVSTDDIEIAEIARQFNVQVHERNPNSAKCNSSSLDGVRDFLNEHPEISVIVLVQCTSPILFSKYLNTACEMILNKGYDSVFSVHRQHKLRWKEVCFDENTIALNFDPKNRPRRQDWKGELVESGHFYAAKVNLIHQGLLQGGRCGYVEIPEEYCFEIDTKKDLIIAETLLKIYKDNL